MALVPANFRQLGDLIGRQRPYAVVPDSVLMPDLLDATSYRANTLPDGTAHDEEVVDIFGVFAQFGALDPDVCPGGPLQLTVNDAPPPDVVPLNQPSAQLRGVGPELQLTFNEQKYTITKALRVPYRYKIVDKTGAQRTVFAHIFVLFNGSGHL